jgi:hypothetical protein
MHCKFAVMSPILWARTVTAQRLAVIANLVAVGGVALGIGDRSLRRLHAR